MQDCTNRANENGYCVSCYSSLSSQRGPRIGAITGSYNTCLISGCSQPSKINGFCQICWQSKTNESCNTPDCKNPVVRNGYCTRCYITLITLNQNTKTNLYYNPKRCQTEDCFNSVKDNQTLCTDCLTSANKHRFVSSRKDIEIPIQIEKPHISSVDVGTANHLNYSNTENVRSNRSVYQSDFRAPSRHSENSAKCSNCGGYVPMHQRKEGLCSRCMESFYLTMGQHHKSNGLLSKTKSPNGTQL
jgi:hypothetical protein